jgi:ABC-type antimicrobial peptide transport system permease subunit
MQDVMRSSVAQQRFSMFLLCAFGLIALLLAGAGLYGVMSYTVARRTKEIGIRMAIGSTRGLIVSQVLRRVAMLMLCGITVGWVLALALRKLLASVVEVHAGSDFALFAGVTAGLALIGILASLGPARAAALTEPVRALRAE